MAPVMAAILAADRLDIASSGMQRASMTFKINIATPHLKRQPGFWICETSVSIV
jgi:hypothetical protein